MGNPVRKLEGNPLNKIHPTPLNGTQQLGQAAFHFTAL